MTESGRTFDPQKLTSEASLQRVVIAALPGVPSGVAGKRAAETCSRDALSRLVHETRGLPSPEPGRLGDQLAHLRSSDDPATRHRARQVLRAYGAALGALLATLKHPDTPDQQGHNPVRHDYLEHWLSVERVWLGGGMLVQDNASEILAGARELLSRTQVSLDLRVGRGPTILPLLGAARMGQPRDGQVLVADAGHTTMKAAVVVVKDGALARVETLPPMQVPPRPDPHTVEASIVDLLAASAATLGIGPGASRPNRPQRCLLHPQRRSRR